MKTDARIRYTKKVIRETFLKLLKEKPIKDITVKEVCEKSEINRATFYKHYKDCNDLMDKISKEMLSDFKSSIENIDLFNIKILTDTILDVIDRNADLSELLITQRKMDMVLSAMVKIAHDQYIDEWKKKIVNLKDNDVEMLFTFLANGLVQVIINNYGKVPLSQISDFIMRTVKITLMPYM